MGRVVWTNAEKQMVEDALVQIFFLSADRHRERALAEAQEKLPMSRRLKINAQRVFNYKLMIERAQMAGIKLRKAKAALDLQTPEPAPEPPPVREIDPSSIGTLFEVLVDRIVDAVYEKVNKRLKADYGQEVERQFDREFAKQNAADRSAMANSAVVAPKKPSILVVGLLPAQANIIRAQFSKDANVYFLGSDEAKHKAWPKVDHIYLMTRFISHSVQTKSRTMGATSGLVDGGTSELTRRINIYLNAKVGHSC